jgi:hypothetical protein
MTRPTTSINRWTPRDYLGAVSLFLATAAFVLWQNSRVAVIWDISYILDSAYRLSLGQIPYRDFPFVHPPLTFLLQATIMRLTGRVFFHHVLYAAIIGGLATVVTWRITFHTLAADLTSVRLLSLLLAAPLSVLGIYSIMPHPFYDCDCIFAILVAILLLQRLEPNSPSDARPPHPILTGIAIVIPLFFKQNIGLPFLLITVAAILVLLIAKILRAQSASKSTLSVAALSTVLITAFTTLCTAAILLHFYGGLRNYLHWTVQFAAQRRLPGLKAMLGVYTDPSLLWTLPCIATALLLTRLKPIKAPWWLRPISSLLLTIPFLWIVLSLFLNPAPEDRADSLLSVWPLLLILSAILALYQLSRGLTLRHLLPIILLATINGTLLSQQLWGSTYAIWPLLILLLAEMLAFLSVLQPKPKLFQLTISIAISLAACGTLYAISEERLSYIKTSTDPVTRSTLPELAGMSAHGPYLPAFDQLVHFATIEIPATDGLILIPGEDPFYFATGRIPQFPLLLFDNTTDPYTPYQLLNLSRTRNIRWLIVKRNLQLNEDPTPQPQAILQALQQDFALYRSLDNYDIYKIR